MQNSGAEQSLVGQDRVSSTTDAEERSILEEKLGWARLERQKVLALSAEADEAIWHLATLARRTMQERDEARSQARMLLDDFQARNAQMMMLPDAFATHAFAASGYSQALAPTPSRPLGETVMQGQHARTGTGYCVASSSNSGHRSFASSLDAYPVEPSSLEGFASSSQDYFDPDMFLVDVAESPQDSVPAMADSGPGKSSGAYGHSTEQKPLQWKDKSARSAKRRAASHGHGPSS